MIRSLTRNEPKMCSNGPSDGAKRKRNLETSKGPDVDVCRMSFRRSVSND